MTKVYVDMVADLFHHGHVELLRQARALGSELLVGIVSDEDVASYKRRPLLSTEERARVVAGCRYVDEVLIGVPLRVTREWIERQGIDLVVHGDEFDEDELRYWYGEAQDMGIFRTVPHTPGISTTELLARLQEIGCGVTHG